MKLETIRRLEREAAQPAGIAPVIDSPELKELLDTIKRLETEKARLATMVGALLPLAKEQARWTHQDLLVCEAAERTLGQVAQ